ncbi:MAG: glycosyltransferase family 2 protein [Thermodesulfovibrionales bacterium]|nr:glycosyltransferase family 2 protein [Thermodesulfovibrionales bacterium]
MIPVSVVIVTKDEEKNIKEAIESVKDFSEIIVIDSFSSDRTVDICKKYTEKVFQEEWQGYARQKQRGIDRASMPWVLILDADERLTPELKSEISNVLNDKHSGFYIPRKNFFLGRWIRHGGWWPDYTLRLFRKDRAFIEEREVHEKVVVKGSTGYLKNPMEHYTSKTFSDFLKKLEDYSTLSAKEMDRRGLRSGILSLTLRPLFTFLKMFFLRRGFLDGRYGLILSLLYSYYTFLKYAKTWEDKNMKGRSPCI